MFILKQNKVYNEWREREWTSQKKLRHSGNHTCQTQDLLVLILSRKSNYIIFLSFLFVSW